MGEPDPRTMSQSQVSKEVLVHSRRNSDAFIDPVNSNM